MTLTLTPTLEHDLAQLAAEAHSTPDLLAQSALEEFVAYRKDLNDAVRRGRDDMKAGRVLSHEEAVARIDALFETR